MSIPSKRVNWAEGMLLTQQHFQELERYFLSWNRSTLALLGVPSWGVYEIEIDIDPLDQERIIVRNLVVVFPSGHEAVINEETPLIMPVKLSAGNKVELYVFHQYEKSKSLPIWSVSHEMRADIYQPHKEAEVSFIKPKIGFCFDKASVNSSDCIKIAEIQWDDERRVVITSGFYQNVSSFNRDNKKMDWLARRYYSNESNKQQRTTDSLRFYDAEKRE